MSNARHLGFTTAGLSLVAGAYFLVSQAPPLSWVLAGTFGLVATYATATSFRTSHRPIVRLKGLTWTREDFCRGWLITGDTGNRNTAFFDNLLINAVGAATPKPTVFTRNQSPIYKR